MKFFAFKVLWLLLCSLWLGISLGISQPALAGPLHPLGSLQRGAQALGQNNYSAAFKQFTQAIEQAPAPAYSNRCLVNLKRADFQSALEDCTAALSLAPQASEALLNLGLAYHGLGHYERALLSYQALLRQHPGDYRAYYNAGLSQSALNRQSEAVQSYSQALSLLASQAERHVSERTEIYRDRATAYLLLANFTAAIQDLSKALEFSPKDVWIHFNLGCVYHQAKNFPAAQEQFAWVIHHDPQHAKAYFNLGLIYAETGHPTLAIQSLQRAIERFQATEKTTAIPPIEDLIARLHRESHKQRQSKIAIG